MANQFNHGLRFQVLAMYKECLQRCTWSGLHTRWLQLSNSSPVAQTGSTVCIACNCHVKVDIPIMPCHRCDGDVPAAPHQPTSGITNLPMQQPQGIFRLFVNLHTLIGAIKVPEKLWILNGTTEVIQIRRIVINFIHSGAHTEPTTSSSTSQYYHIFEAPQLLDSMVTFVVLFN
ncbi:hypothetical protein CASFOL_028719 [Castilleja foliolosa]|uniref:Uncharacterized protein n=1 Tax=Castilleja foliolosa TaxID=1961234 RepID=A0ABD3CEB3_9LAMI